VGRRPDLLERVENRLAAELGLAPGAILLDFPAKPEMLAVDLPMRMRDDRIERLDAADRMGLVGIHRIADELHLSARRLRVFVAEPVAVDRTASGAGMLVRPG
jgi:hypothetical protein